MQTNITNLATAVPRIEGELAREVNPETVREQQSELRALRSRLFRAEQKVLRLEQSATLHLQVDEAVSNWLYDERLDLVFDDGTNPPLHVAVAIDDHERVAEFNRYAALTRHLVASGHRPDAILRMRCAREINSCGEAACSCDGATSTLRIPAKIERLIAEVKRGR